MGVPRLLRRAALATHPRCSAVRHPALPALVAGSCGSYGKFRSGACDPRAGI